jgi:hypothetical protein
MTEFMLNASSIKPAQLFEGRLLRVPDYQRGYAWEQRQLEEFLEDLDLLPKGSVHYTGTVVLHCSDGSEVKDKRGKTYRVYDIVDGQQRLTTIVILLDAIRRELGELHQNDLAAGIYDTFIAVPDRNGQLLAKLKLNQDCHRFFFDNVLHDIPCLDGNKIRSHRNLSYAKQYFQKYLCETKDAMKGNYPQWLEDLRDKVCDQLVLTMYPVQQDADAGVIFEVMNNRGKPITELEKAKNYLLYLASKLQLPEKHHLDKRVNSTWTHIFTRLMSSNLGAVENEDQLLRVHWLMVYDPVERKWDGSKSLKSRFHLRDFKGKHDALLQELLSYVQTLRDASTAYCDVANPRHPEAFSDLLGDPKLRDRVIAAGEKLSRLRVVAPFLPLLVAIRLKHSGNGGLYLRALELCERYAFRVYRLLGKRSNAGRSTLFLMAHGLYTGELTAQNVLLGLVMLIKKYSPDSDVEHEYAVRTENNDYNWTGLKYFLYEYEAHLASRRNKNIRMSWAQLEREDAKEHSIEHILPQTPTDNYWLSRWNDAQREKYTHDVGNLCLTLDNSSYGNRPFPEKRGAAGSSARCYANGDLVMERELAAFTDWTEQTLLQRHEQIVAWARDRWGLPQEFAAVREKVDLGIDNEDLDVDVCDPVVDPESVGTEK